MREILFRGKILEEDDVSQNGNWVYGYLVYAKSDFDDETQRVADIIPHDTDRVYKGEYNVVFPCDIKTIGQYTGLTDKNGNKVFEGDIVKAEINGGAYDKFVFPLGVVAFENGVFGTKDAKNFTPLSSYAPRVSFEVVGNVHDNPELLEGKQ